MNPYHTFSRIRKQDETVFFIIVIWKMAKGPIKLLFFGMIALTVVTVNVSAAANWFSLKTPFPVVRGM